MKSQRSPAAEPSSLLYVGPQQHKEVSGQSSSHSFHSTEENISNNLCIDETKQIIDGGGGGSKEFSETEQ